MTQESIAVPKPPPIEERPCAWCLRPSVREVVIEHERKSAAGDVLRRERAVPVCGQHSNMVERCEQVAHLHRRRRIWFKRIGHPRYAHEQPAVRAELRRIENSLEALGETLAERLSER